MILLVESNKTVEWVAYRATIRNPGHTFCPLTPGVSQGIIEATATPLQTGRRTQLWEITMHNEGRLVARTTLRTMVMGRQ